MTEVKICGMMRSEDIEASRLADFNGFVVASESRRSLSLELARELMSICTTRKVLVTTATSVPELERLAGRLDPDVLQVHSAMDEKELQLLARSVSAPIWALVPVGGGDELVRGRHMARCSDAAVLDTYAKALGGTGIAHDWNVSRKVRDELHPFPVVLAGGMNPRNVAKGVAMVRPAVVDVSSGVERNASKDPFLITEFIENARRTSQ